jgi:hypothetical protein
MALAMVLLPQPDSPTSAKVSPCGSKDTPSTRGRGGWARPRRPAPQSKPTSRGARRRAGGAARPGRRAPMRGTRGEECARV